MASRLPLLLSRTVLAAATALATFAAGCAAETTDDGTAREEALTDFVAPRSYGEGQLH
jgi:hypothetical protein